jgi:hypothetical protein
MSYARPVYVALILCFAISTHAPASDREGQVQPVAAVSEDAAVVPTFLELPLEELPPRLRAIREVLDAQNSKLVELQARYEAATSDDQALLVQREMHELKRGTELAMINAQLEFARQEGNTEKIAELEAILESVELRAGVMGPAERPAREQP